MAPKPPKPKAKQDNRVLTPARRAVLYDQWLGGRSLEELSAKWRKPIHRINEALTMERAERKVAQAIKDSNERKASHEIGIIAPIETALSYTEVDAALTRLEDESVPTIEGDPLPASEPPAAIVQVIESLARAQKICEEITGILDLPKPRPIPDPIETVTTYSEVEATFDAIDKALPAEVGRPPTPVADLIEDAIKRRLG